MAWVAVLNEEFTYISFWEILAGLLSLVQFSFDKIVFKGLSFLLVNRKISLGGGTMKKLIFILVILAVIFFVGVAIYIKVSPVFGGNPTKEEEQFFSQLDNYEDG